MNETKTAKVETVIRGLLRSGVNPNEYKNGVADQLDVTVANVEAVIARVGGSPREISREELVDERTFAEARSRQSNPQSWLDYDHEESA